MTGPTPRRLAPPGALLITAAALAACGGGSATPAELPASSSSTGTAPKPAPRAGPRVGQGQRVRASATVLKVRVRRVIDPLTGGGAAGAASPGARGIGVVVEVRNAGGGVYDSSSKTDVTLSARGGAPAALLFVPGGGCATSERDFLKLVAPGETRRGCVAFEMPRSSRPALVRFAPDGSARRAARWAVSGG